MSSNDEDLQHETDLATVRAHLKRGANPSSGMCMWGGLEWAVARLLGIEPEAVA